MHHCHLGSKQDSVGSLHVIYNTDGRTRQRILLQSVNHIKLKCNFKTNADKSLPECLPGYSEAELQFICVFNINLVQINEREKYAEFLDWTCTNNLFPRIYLSKRIAKRSQSFDKMSYKVPFNNRSDFSTLIAWMLYQIISLRCQFHNLE